MMTLRTWKSIKAGLITLAILGLAVFAIVQGADPTTTAIVAIVMAGLLNGIEFSEFIAVWGEIKAEQALRSDQDDNDSDQ